MGASRLRSAGHEFLARRRGPARALVGGIVLLLSVASSLAARGADAGVGPVVAERATNAGTPGARFGGPARVLDLGRVRPQQRLDIPLTFTNQGTAALQLSDLHGSCSCVHPGLRELAVPPGEHGVVPLEFYASDLGGPFSETLTFATNDPREPEVTLEFKGVVWRVLEALPAFVTLDVTPDSWTNQTAAVRIANHGETPIQLEPPVANQPAFAATFTTNRPGFAWDLIVRTTRPLPNANHYGRFTFKTSSPEVPRLEVTAFVPALSAVVATPRQLRIPAGPLAQPETRVLWLRGTTGLALQLSDPTPPSPGVTTVVDEIEPGRLFRATLTFPAAFVLPPDRRLEFTVRSNHPQFPILRIPVTTPATNPPVSTAARP